MAYIGARPTSNFRVAPVKDSFTGNGSTTAFDLANIVPAGGENALQVFMGDMKMQKAMNGEGDETLVDLADHAKEELKKEKEKFGETITLNGQKYKPIKESKESNPRIFKEIYDRTFRSLKWNN